MLCVCVFRLLCILVLLPIRVVILVWLVSYLVALGGEGSALAQAGSGVFLQSGDSFDTGEKATK